MGIEEKHSKGFGRFLLRFICRLIPALVGVALIAFIVLIPFVSTTNGGSEVKELCPSYLAKDININGTHVDNYFLDKPVLQAHGEFYIPATDQMLSALGIRYLNLGVELEELAPIDIWGDPFWKTADTWLKKSRQESTDAVDLLEIKLEEAQPIEVGTTLVTNLKASSRISTSSEEFIIAKVSSFANFDIRNGWDRVRNILEAGSVISLDDYGKNFFADNEDVSIVSENGSELFFDEDGMMYFTSAFLEKLGFDCEYDDLTGLYISTVDGVSAADLYDEELAHRITVLSDYMIRINKSLDKETAVWYEYIFRHEAAVHGIDEITIMAVAKVESTFRADAVGNGSVGLMQPLVKYAVNYGYDRVMLMNPHYNVELCSKYLMDRLHMFGSEELMLVAYNKGSASVRAGRRHSTYSDKVLKVKNTILELLNVQS